LITLGEIKAHPTA